MSNSFNNIELVNRDFIDEDDEDNQFEKELKEAFDEFDYDKSGTIDKEEFANFMQKLGYKPTLVEIQEMIDEVDKDKNGCISFDEFKYLMTKTIKDDFTVNSSIEAFSVFDTNKTGKITRNELINILGMKGESILTTTEILELMKNITFGENDEINYADFVKTTLDLFKN